MNIREMLAIAGVILFGVGFFAVPYFVISTILVYGILLIIAVVFKKRSLKTGLQMMGLEFVYGVTDLVMFIYNYYVEAKIWLQKQSPRMQYGVVLLLAVSSTLVCWQLIKTYKSISIIPITSASSVAVPYPDLVPAPLGAQRFASTKEQLDWRVDKIIDTRKFWIMREGGALKGAQRITRPDYQSYLEAAASFYHVNKDDIEDIHFLESFGEEGAMSPTGPKGPGQFSATTAANIGPVKDGQCLLLYATQKCGDKKPKGATQIVQDNRGSIELSVYATAKLLKSEIDFFGNADFAIMAYHSSRNDVRAWVMKYLEPQPTTVGGKSDIEKYNLTYAQLYFGSTPYHNAGTYAMYRAIMDEDWGANYLWKIRCAGRLLDLYRQNPSAFKKLADDNTYQGKRAKYRMWTFYRPEDEALISLSDLKSKISTGELITVPDNPEKFGFKFNWSEIGEMDKPNKTQYISTKRETAGALLWISQELQRLRATQNTQSFLLDVTSISRTVDYQNKLTKKNTTATKQLSFHVLGLAFDITKNGLSASQDTDLKFILDELDSTGMISWVPENAAYHIVVAPDSTAREFFTRVYNEAAEFHQTSSPLQTTAGWY